MVAEQSISFVERVPKKTFVSFLEEAWSTFLEKELVTYSKGTELLIQGPDLLTSVLHFNGDWLGALLIFASRKMLTQVVGELYGTPPSKVGQDDIYDVFSELTGMLAGNIVSLLPEGVTMGMTTVVKGRQLQIQLPKAHPVYKLRFLCEGNPVIVMVIEAD